MPVGMTLQQLYSQPTYHSDAMGSGPMAVSGSSAMAVSVASASVAPGSKRPPTINTNAPPSRAAPSQYADHHSAAMQQQQQQAYPSPYSQLPPPHSYAQYHSKAQGPSEEYGIADPLPFEYMGMRKFPDAGKDHSQPQPDHRYNTGDQYPTNYSAHSPHPSVYDNQQHVHPPKTVEDRAYHQPYANDRAYHNGVDPSAHFQHAPPPSNMPAHLYASGAMNPMTHNGVHHSFPPLLDAGSLKKETAGGGDRETQQYSPQGPVEYAAATPQISAPGGATQEAVIKVKTPLKTKYWRNGRRNLQCFPSCKVFGDYSSIKIEDLKQHDFMWGKCRGSLITEVTLNSSVSFDDILILGRVHSLENVPVAFEEAVIRECMLGRMVEPDVMDSMKDQWITGERLPDFVQQEGNTACYEFKPKVWKYTEDMTQGKCKRRNVKYYVQFEAFVLVMSGERRYYACIGSGMSTAFEVGSSRVLARQKRKASTGLDANPLYMKPGQGPSSPVDTMGANVMQHPMMQQQQQQGMMPMHSQMYQPNNYAPQGYPPVRMGHSSMMNQMHHDTNAQFYHQATPQQHHQQPPQQHQHQHQHQQQPQQHQPQPAPVQSAPARDVQKRKASPTSERVPKAKKTKQVAVM